MTFSKFHDISIISDLTILKLFDNILCKKIILKTHLLKIFRVFYRNVISIIYMCVNIIRTRHLFGRTHIANLTNLQWTLKNKKYRKVCTTRIMT